MIWFVKQFFFIISLQKLESGAFVYTMDVQNIGFDVHNVGIYVNNVGFDVPDVSLDLIMGGPMCLCLLFAFRCFFLIGQYGK